MGYYDSAGSGGGEGGAGCGVLLLVPLLMVLAQGGPSDSSYEQVSTPDRYSATSGELLNGDDDDSAEPDLDDNSAPTP